MQRGRAVALVMVVLAAAVGTGWAAPQPVTLELKGQPGTESRYQTKVSLVIDLTAPIAQGSALTVSPRVEGQAVTVDRVVNVAPNGNLTVGTRVESFDFKVDVADFHAQVAIQGPGGGPPQLIKLPELPVQTVMTKRGKPVAVKGLDKVIPPLPLGGPGGEKLNLGDLITKALAQFAQPLYPEKPVSVGETWGWETTIEPGTMLTKMGLPLPAGAKQQLEAMKFPVKTTSTLVAFESVAGVECAKIETTVPWQVSMPVPMPTGDTATLSQAGGSKVTTWFDYTAGRKVKEVTEFNMEMTVSVGAAAPVKMTVRLDADSELR